MRRTPLKWTGAGVRAASGGAALLVTMGALAGCGAGSSSAGVAGGAGAGSGAGTSSSGTVSSGTPSSGPASTGSASSGSASAVGGSSASCTTSVPPADRVTLGPADSGRTVCVARGSVVTVVLPGSQERPWRFEAQGEAMVAATDTHLALPVGRQGAAYRAATAGTAHLLAARAACPSPKPGEMACMAVEQSWSVSVVVR